MHVSLYIRDCGFLSPLPNLCPTSGSTLSKCHFHRVFMWDVVSVVSVSSHGVAVFVRCYSNSCCNGFEISLYCSLYVLDNGIFEHTGQTDRVQGSPRGDNTHNKLQVVFVVMFIVMLSSFLFMFCTTATSMICILQNKKVRWLSITL